jgi:hypothetical protein
MHFLTQQGCVVFGWEKNHSHQWRKDRLKLDTETIRGLDKNRNQMLLGGATAKNHGGGGEDLLFLPLVVPGPTTCNPPQQHHLIKSTGLEMSSNLT